MNHPVPAMRKESDDDRRRRRLVHNYLFMALGLAVFAGGLWWFLGW
jgi:hypothetical protein